VLTKASELYGAIQCSLPSGQRLEAEFVGHHRDSDLALLKVDGEDLPAFELRTSDPPPVGSWLLTTDVKGSPAAIGVMSVKPRPIKSDPALLGVQLRDSDDGPQVTFVMPDSAAQEAGVKVNDIVTHVEGDKMGSQRELVESIRKFLPGERVRLRVKRGESFKSLLATLGSVASVNRRQHVQNNLGGPKLSKRNKGFPAALQHDTALHPHQCGGPLVDLDGNLVGINIAHADRVSSLALPTSAILPLLDDLKSGKLRPTPIPGEAELALETRAEELRRIVKTWQAKLSEIEKSLGDSQAAEARALEAAQQDADDARKLLDETRAAKEELEKAFREASEKLQDLTSELKEIESKVALQSN
jgi:serine protease Do